MRRRLFFHDVSASSDQAIRFAAAKRDSIDSRMKTRSAQKRAGALGSREGPYVGHVAGRIFDSFVGWSCLHLVPTSHREGFRNAMTLINRVGRKF
jgi:hypothetical protein